MCMASTKRHEVLQDKCQEAVYVIDNSGSMSYYHDGKSFVKLPDGKVKMIRNITRWEEAVSKVCQIAESADLFIVDIPGHDDGECRDFAPS